MQNSKQKMKKTEIHYSIAKNVDEFWLTFGDCRTVQRSALCRSRRELPNSNEYLLDEIGVDTAENEPLEVWGKIQFIFHSPPYPRRSWGGSENGCAFLCAPRCLECLLYPRGIFRGEIRLRHQQGVPRVLRRLRRQMKNELNFHPNFEGLVLGCIDADFCK